MMTLSAYGRLGRDPKPITTRTGKAMAVASLAVTVSLREDGETVDATQWVNITAFGKVADDLARHSKGEMLSVIGRAQLNRYRPQDGATRDDLGDCGGLADERPHVAAIGAQGQLGLLDLEPGP